MAEPERLLPVQSIDVVLEIIDQHRLWQRRNEFTRHAWNVSGRVYRHVTAEHEADELSEKDMIRLETVRSACSTAVLDGISYTAETDRELAEISVAMTSLNTLNSLLALINRMGNDQPGITDNPATID